MYEEYSKITPDVSPDDMNTQYDYYWNELSVYASGRFIGGQDDVLHLIDIG